MDGRFHNVDFVVVMCGVTFIFGRIFYSHIPYSGYMKGQFDLCECSSCQPCHHLIVIAKCLLIRVAGLSALLHGRVLVETHNGNFKHTVQITPVRMFITIIPTFQREKSQRYFRQPTRYIVLRKGRKYLPKQWTAEYNTDLVGRIHSETERIKQRVAEATSHLTGKDNHPLT